MDIIIAIIQLVVGGALVLWGADRLTDGASAIARRFGVSELVIGLTIVSLGTSLPEFMVSLLASFSGTADMSVGNVVGSNLFNALVIVGASALVCPIAVSRNTVLKDIPFVILATAMLAALLLDVQLSGADKNMLSRGDGIALTLTFLVFMAYTFSISGNGMTVYSPDDNQGEREVQENQSSSLWRSLLWVLVGLACLVLGGDWFVDGATVIALSMGMSEMMVGMTIVACGTSLPEFATSVIAASKGHSAMAIGNVIGSNVFNILFVLGICSCVNPMTVTEVGIVEICMLLFSSLLFWEFSRSHYRINRIEGIVLIVCYIIYMVFKIITSI